MNDNLFNISHLLKVEQDEQDDLNSIPFEEKMDISKLYGSKQNTCTFDPYKVTKNSEQEAYDSLNKSEDINEDKKSLMLCSIKQFKKQLTEMIEVINNFFDNFTTELTRKNNIDELYENYITSLDQIKQSMNDIFNEASIGKPIEIETLKSLKLESSLKGSILQDNPERNTLNRGSKLSLSKLAESKCRDSECTINHVIDRLVYEYKEQNTQLKQDNEKLKNKNFIYENLVVSSKKLIEEIYSKNKFLKEKLIKYKLSK
jgi:hypothetical protein